jgi:hypothetical protein
MAHPERFELPTNWFEASYSIQLSYGCVGTELAKFAGLRNITFFCFLICISIKISGQRSDC